MYVRSGDNRFNDIKDLSGKELVGLEDDNSIEFIKRNNITDKIFLTKTFEDAFCL